MMKGACECVDYFFFKSSGEHSTICCLLFSLYKFAYLNEYMTSYSKRWEYFQILKVK